MTKQLVIVVTLLGAITLLGCQTNRYNNHSVPVSRDYKALPKVHVKEACKAVDTAHRVGAEHRAGYSYLSSSEWLAKEPGKSTPEDRAAYNYISAKCYLDLAREEKCEGDKKGGRDYAALAKNMAEEATKSGAKIPDKGIPLMLKDAKECKAEFDRLKARWSELNAEKAAEVAPGIYANATAALSHAEHELNEWGESAQVSRILSTIEADIDTILAQDVDRDGVPDMKDGAPMDPEDKDGFQDEDGVPDLDNDKDNIWDHDDKKPLEPETYNRWHDEDGTPDSYPILEMIHYASGSASINADTCGYLRGIIYMVVEWPGLKLHIAGHTDDVASDGFNNNLSKKRAEGVQNYLVKHGCPANQLVVSSHGESQPIADNKTAKGKAENRRVELKFE